MKKNYIRSVVVHGDDVIDVNILSDKINELHVLVIQRQLQASSLSTERKLAVIDNIVECLRRREVDGIIR